MAIFISQNALRTVNKNPKVCLSKKRLLKLF